MMDIDILITTKMKIYTKIQLRESTIITGLHIILSLCYGLLLVIEIIYYSGKFR
jgi:hypothetical protein